MGILMQQEREQLERCGMSSPRPGMLPQQGEMPVFCSLQHHLPGKQPSCNRQNLWRHFKREGIGTGLHCHLQPQGKMELLHLVGRACGCMGYPTGTWVCVLQRSSQEQCFCCSSHQPCRKRWRDFLHAATTSAVEGKHVSPPRYSKTTKTWERSDWW